MQNGFEHLDSIAILLAEMSAIECTYEGCAEGAGGTRWKTPVLEAQFAMELYRNHLASVHGQQGADPTGVPSKSQLTKIPRLPLRKDVVRKTFKGSRETGSGMSGPLARRMR